MIVVAVATATHESFRRYVRSNEREHEPEVRYVHVKCEEDCRGQSFDEVRAVEPYVWLAFYRARRQVRTK